MSSGDDTEVVGEGLQAGVSAGLDLGDFTFSSDDSEETHDDVVQVGSKVVVKTKRTKRVVERSDADFIPDFAPKETDISPPQPKKGRKKTVARRIPFRLVRRSTIVSSKPVSVPATIAIPPSTIPTSVQRIPVFTSSTTEPSILHAQTTTPSEAVT